MYSPPELSKEFDLEVSATRAALKIKCLSTPSLSKKTKAFPKLLKVLQNHTQSTKFMIHLFNKSLVNDCDYKTFTHGLLLQDRAYVTIGITSNKLTA
jgi:hypothetical protein